MSNKPNTKILLYRVKKNKDSEAYAEIYDLYVKQIYRFVYYKVSSHEEAEDITSEVFLKAWNYINEGNKVENIKALFYRLARNSIIDLYRKKSVRKELQIEDIEEIAISTSVTDQVADKIETENILQNLKKLKTEYREVLVLKYIDELKTHEIAKVMGKSQTSVRVLTHRAIKRLKLLMK